MKANNAGWQAKAFSDRVSRWVATELDKGGDGGVEWCEDLMRRSDRELGTHVPVATIKAHVFAIQKRREKAAIGGTTDG